MSMLQNYFLHHGYVGKTGVCPWYVCVTILMAPCSQHNGVVVTFNETGITLLFVYAEYHYAKCDYDEWRGTSLITPSKAIRTARVNVSISWDTILLASISLV